MSKKPTTFGFQVMASASRRTSVGKSASSKVTKVISKKGTSYPPRGSAVAKPESEVAVKIVPLDPDAFMDYLLEEDAIIMEHLAK